MLTDEQPSDKNQLPRYDWHSVRPMTDFTYWEPAQARITTLEGRLAKSAAEIERLRAHIQSAASAADIAVKKYQALIGCTAFASSNNLIKRLVKMFTLTRGAHQDALPPREKTT